MYYCEDCLNKAGRSNPTTDIRLGTCDVCCKTRSCLTMVEKMKIYKIEIEDQGYDTFNCFVISAKNIEKVVEIAQKRSADEGKEIWKEESIITILGEATPNITREELLCASFNAG